ncbi:MAG: hypothetical protein RJB13_1040 [Pseudomonadota bacterium]|jgi:hypothetical protein
MSMDKNQNNRNTSAKDQILAHYRSYVLSPASRQNLLSTLNQTQVQQPVLIDKTTWFTKHRTVLLSSILSALAAASATFLLLEPRNESQIDPIAELALLPAGHKLYPPDFDLDGDSANLNEIINDIFADKNFFVSDLPPQIIAEYSPATGRFFSWDGEPAVSIEMNKSNASVTGSQAATLFIVKLSDKTKRKFPKDKQIRKITGRTGKMRKLKVWREGNFGYAMLQDNPINTP